MSINWNNLESEIKKCFDMSSLDYDGTYSIDIISKQIEDLYMNEIKSNATDSFGNKVLDISTGGLYLTLKKSFEESIKNNSIEILKKTAISGLLYNFNNCKFNIISPPGVIQVGILNSVVFAGDIIQLEYDGDTDKAEMHIELVNSFKIHASTIRGIFSGLNSSGNKIDIPWQGIL